MKRSNNLRLARFRKKVPTATVAALSVTLAVSGCAPAPMETAQIYTNVDECVSQYPDQPQLCEQVFGSAQVEHLATAPRFETQAACESEFGAEACQAAPEGSQGNSFGGSWFMPMMMGYMMGNLLSGNRSPRYAPVYGSRSSSSPLNGKMVTGNGTVVGNIGDRTVQPNSSAFQKSAAPTRISRAGGFGQMAAQKAAATRATTTNRSASSFGG
ncbi:MAG: DUF1190 domain-containing protein [Ferrimonas sp.]